MTREQCVHLFAHENCVEVPAHLFEKVFKLRLYRGDRKLDYTNLTHKAVIDDLEQHLGFPITDVEIMCIDDRTFFAFEPYTGKEEEKANWLTQQYKEKKNIL